MTIEEWKMLAPGDFVILHTKNSPVSDKKLLDSTICIVKEKRHLYGEHDVIVEECTRYRFFLDEVEYIDNKIHDTEIDYCIFLGEK